MQACPLPDDKIVIYGGEDSHRRPLAEAYVLDLQEFTWKKIQVTSKQQPVARSGHAATLVNNLLIIFGGEYAGSWRQAVCSGSCRQALTVCRWRRTAYVLQATISPCRNTAQLLSWSSGCCPHAVAAMTYGLLMLRWLVQEALLPTASTTCGCWTSTAAHGASRMWQGPHPLPGLAMGACWLETCGTSWVEATMSRVRVPAVLLLGALHRCTWSMGVCSF